MHINTIPISETQSDYISSRAMSRYYMCRRRTMAAQHTDQTGSSSHQQRGTTVHVESIKWPMFSEIAPWHLGGMSRNDQSRGEDVIYKLKACTTDIFDSR